MITTIQIHEKVKNELEKLKTNRESYEDIILNLIKINEIYKRKKDKLLVEGCKAMSEENLRITKEFEALENLDNWEW